MRRTILFGFLIFAIGCVAHDDDFLDRRIAVATLDSVLENSDSVMVTLVDARLLLGTIWMMGFGGGPTADSMTIREIVAWMDQQTEGQSEWASDWLAGADERQAETDERQSEWRDELNALRRQLSDVAEMDKPQAVVDRLPAVEARSFEFVSINYRVTEKNSTWWRFAWTLELRNTGTESLYGMTAKIEFLDSGGFVVDTDTEYSISLAVDETKTVRGSALIRTNVAGSIASVYGKVR